MAFNAAQLKAISHTDGPCMVLAGPGSGKTTVITYRVRGLIRSGVAEPKHILVVTFTRAAANEMKERFLKLCGNDGEDGTERAEAVNFGTFHSVFFGMLRMHRKFSGDSLLTESEKIRLVEEVFRALHYDTENGRDVMISLLSEISSVKNNLLSAKEFTSAVPGISFQEVFALYEKKARSLGKIDFDDMMTETLRMLREEPKILEFWRDRFRYILVDEFQDINPLQYEIMRMLAAPRNNIFVVGDDDQSIYRFRGARPEIMLNFGKDYPRSERILLDVNYRSGKGIVTPATALIRHNRKRYEKKIRADRKEKGTVEIRRFPNEVEEARETAAEILKLREGKLPLHEIAVLYRTNSCARPVAEALMDAKIPFVSKDRMQNLFRHFVCGPVFAMLNWTRGDRTRGNFLKFMNCPVRFIRRDDLKHEMIDLEALKAQYVASQDRQWMAEKIAWLQYQLDFLARTRTPFAMVNYIRKSMEYDRHVTDDAEKRQSDPKELLGVLDELQASATPFETVADWYAHIADYTRELDRQDGARNVDLSNRVFLSTLHGAKGLEFDTVFILDVNEKILPHEKSSGQDAIEEERRMFYVGMTRAIRTLKIYSASEHYGKKTDPSRFLRELGML